MAEFLDTFLNIDLLLQIWPMLLRGLWMTLLLAAISVPLAILFGLAAAVLHDLAGPVLRWMVLLVVDLLRAVPPLVLLIFLFYAAPLLGLRLSEMTAAVITLVLNGGAYYAEIFRGGIGTVPRGQREAARSTGLTQLQTMRSVVLPQGTRAVLPDLLSNTLELVKQTSIASAVAMQELMRVAQIAQGSFFNPTPIIAVAVIYLALFLPVVRLVSRLQNKSSAVH